MICCSTVFQWQTVLCLHAWMLSPREGKEMSKMPTDTQPPKRWPKFHSFDVCSHPPSNENNTRLLMLCGSLGLPATVLCKSLHFFMKEPDFFVFLKVVLNSFLGVFQSFSLTIGCFFTHFLVQSLYLTKGIFWGFFV